jgi:hypothetical protein
MEKLRHKRTKNSGDDGGFSTQCKVKVEEATCSGMERTITSMIEEAIRLGPTCDWVSPMHIG